MRKVKIPAWKKFCENIANYSSAADPQCIKAVRQALVVEALKKLIGYEEEFSSVADAYIHKTAPEAIRVKVYG
ncbi:MAG: hypothetical protein ABI475_03005 [Methylophilaceae bacterium]